MRYRQNNIIAYQDNAWGDGKILIDYRCSPGVVVDRYRPAQKTFLLISLQEPKRRGDIDEFNMEWKIKMGLSVQRSCGKLRFGIGQNRLDRIIFPKARPP